VTSQLRVPAAKSRPLCNTTNNFEAELYGTAFDRAQSARRDFERAVDDIDDEATYPPEDSVDETFRDHAAEWENEASEIENGASGRQTETDN